jgi:hypothetical protein
LVVSIHCPEPYTELKRFPWKFALQSVEGGLFVLPSSPGKFVSLERLHLAPEDGYAPMLSMAYPHDSTPFQVQYEGTFYLKSRNGQVYAKLRFDVSTRWDERGVPFGIQAVVNTNASRNLQTPVGQ